MFESYEECRRAAIIRARAIEAKAPGKGLSDQGLEFNKLLKCYIHFTLPLVPNRYGFEARCEVVKASDPL